MATYLILNLVILSIVALCLRQRPKRPSIARLATLGGILILTLVFDNLLIALGMFSYAPDKILGLHIGLAPVEDFMYPLLAVLLIPTLWNRLEARRVR